MWNVVGIDEHEERVYEALVRRRQAAPIDLANALELPRARVARTLTRLVNKGIATRLSGRPARFAAVAPDQAAASLIAGHESEMLRLRNHAQHLAELYRRAAPREDHPADLVEVIEGQPNIARVFAKLQHDARREIRGFDRPPYVVEDGAQEAQQLETGPATYRVVYDRSALAIPGRIDDIWKGIHDGERARVGDVPMKMMLCDDTAAMIPAENIDASYLIYRSPLLDAMIALFEAVWDRSVSMHRLQEPDRSAGLSAEDKELLALLAAGHTDENIARIFDWNVRTVRRHIHNLAERVGAQTRFQLGMESSRKQWI